MFASGFIAIVGVAMDRSVVFIVTTYIYIYIVCNLDVWLEFIFICIVIVFVICS